MAMSGERGSGGRRAGWGGSAVIGLAAVAGLAGLAGAGAWGWGAWAMGHDEVVGVNIGAGLLIMLGWGLLGVAAVISVAAIIAAVAERR